MVQIIKVKCPRCRREFRTVPTVLEHRGSPRCSACGTRMQVSKPQPVNILSKTRAGDAA